MLMKLTQGERWPLSSASADHAAVLQRRWLSGAVDNNLMDEGEVLFVWWYSWSAFLNNNHFGSQALTLSDKIRITFYHVTVQWQLKSFFFTSDRGWFYYTRDLIKRPPESTVLQEILRSKKLRLTGRAHKKLRLNSILDEVGQSRKVLDWFWITKEEKV